MLERIGGQIPIGPEFKGAAGGNITGVEAVETGSIEMKSLDDGMRMNSKEEVAEAVNSMNTFLKSSPNTHLKFEFHDKLNEYYVTIIDEVTREVVKEIPPKKLLDMFAAMTEVLGIMVDKKI